MYIFILYATAVARLVLHTDITNVIHLKGINWFVHVTKDTGRYAVDSFVEKYFDI